MLINWDELGKLIKEWGNPLVAGVIVFLVGLFARDLFPNLISFVGKALRWLWAVVRGKGAELEFEKEYLNWLIGEHHNLGVLPAQVVIRRWGDRQKFVELEDVYVNLSMSAKGGDEEWTAAYGAGRDTWRRRPWFGLGLFRYLFLLFLPAERLEKAHILVERKYQPGDLGLVVDRHQRLVIRGDPGSGKTTLVRYLAVTCARALRNHKKEGDSAHLVRERLLWSVRPFPILISLSRHGKVVSWGEGRSLCDTILEEMPTELRSKCPKQFFERRLKNGNCLVLLDAFDELGSPEARGAMARRIDGFLGFYDKSGNRMVVTTRIVGYEGQLDKYGFEVRTVQNLGPGEIRALVKQRYKAIALSETVGRHAQDAKTTTQMLVRRAERLIERIESTPRLGQLASNPMLLSLIVLVHFLKVELPEERLLLYRDCVEILTERWQRVKREEAGITSESSDELTLSQKLVLLRELAFAMQQQRKEEGSQALISKSAARDIIASKLPDFLKLDLPQSENAGRALCRRKAVEWLDGIQVQSGILVEKGLDESGEPLVGFSHLTFQEYLVAVAANEVDGYREHLWRNLVNPTWREVVLLYSVLCDDSTPLIRTLLDFGVQSGGLLLAGYCLTEKLKRVEASVRERVVFTLKNAFVSSQPDQVAEFGKILGTIGGSETTQFLRRQLVSEIPYVRQSVIRSLGLTRPDDLEIEEARNDLVQILDVSDNTEEIVAARESLAQIGDPRFIHVEPVMVHIPRYLVGTFRSLKAWRELISIPKWAHSERLVTRLMLFVRAWDRLLWIISRVIAQRKLDVHIGDFEIGKYPITNLEYLRFVEDTGHQSPKSWVEGIFPSEQATYPVTGLHPDSAVAFCRWLSRKTGQRYRLPSEWEWEISAIGGYEWKYPWGNEFDETKCNAIESHNEGTTPVGAYRRGASPCGVHDMSGNVWEITTTIFFPTHPINLMSSGFFLIGAAMIGIGLLLSGWKFAWEMGSFMALTSALLVLYFNVNTVVIRSVLRGGAWNSSANESTCFQRECYNIAKKPYCGFRCLKEL